MQLRSIIGFMIISAVVPTRVTAQLQGVPVQELEVPEIILNATRARDEAYQELLKNRRQERVQILRRITGDSWFPDPAALDALQHYLSDFRRSLLLSLGDYGAQNVVQLHSRDVWPWNPRYYTAFPEIAGNPVPRTKEVRSGLLEEIHIASPSGPDITALLVKAKGLEQPYRTVICLPSVDSYTVLAQRKESLIGHPRIRALTNAGFLVVAADIPALRDLKDREVKWNLVCGMPSLGRITAGISLLVSYLHTREDIQSHRIAVYGEGLSGFAASLAASVDPKIWAVVSVNGIPSFQALIAAGEQIPGAWLLPRFLQYADGPALAQLIAPRPLLTIAARRETQRVDTPYDAHTFPDGLHPLAWETSVHNLPLEAEPVLRFFDASDHLQVNVESEEYSPRLVEFLRRSIDMPVQQWEGQLRSAAEVPDEIIHPEPLSITDVVSATEWHSVKRTILENMSRLLGGFPDRGTDHSGIIVEQGREENRIVRTLGAAPYDADEFDPGFAVKPFTWERILVQTTPNTFLPVIITKSPQVQEPAPLVIDIPGHSISHEDDALRMGGELAERGLMGAFVNQKAGTGFWLGGTQRDACGILEGRPMEGEWAWNLMGLVDYLQTRPDVNPEHIGVMGWSMGATTLSYFMPFDERIKAGAGFVAFTNMKGIRRSFRSEHVVHGDLTSNFDAHPLYNQIPEILRYCDVDDLLATIAPRPLLSLAATQDQYLPYEITKEVFQRHTHIWGLLGIRDRIDFLVVRGVHDLLPPLREKAMNFFEKWLKQ